MRRIGLRLGRCVLMLLIFAMSVSPVLAEEVQFSQTFHIRSYFDCWRNEQGEWTMELGGQGAQVLGVPGEAVDYIIPYPLPSELQDAELVVEEANWDPLTPGDPYYAESIASGQILDVFLTEDQRLCVRVGAVLSAVIAPEDITQSWQNPPILGLRFIVPLQVSVRGAKSLPEAQGEIVFAPNSTEETAGATRGWYNQPHSVQVSYLGEEPFLSYQQDARQYDWSERTYIRQMLELGYSPWALEGEAQETGALPRSSKFWLNPIRLRVEGNGSPRNIPDTSSISLDTETDGLSLTGSVSEFDTFFAGYLLSEADVRGSLDETSYLVPDYGSYQQADLPEAQLPTIQGMSGIYRLDFSPPQIDLTLPDEGWRNAEQLLALQLSDNLSGLYRTSCLIEDLSWMGNSVTEEIWLSGDCPSQITLGREGAFLVNLSSEDMAGNVNSVEYGLYLLDFTTPTISDCQLGGISLSEGLEHVPYEDTMMFSFQARDDLSGLAEVEYGFVLGEEPGEPDWEALSFLDHDDLMRTHQLDFEVELTELPLAQCSLHIRLTDRAGNVCYQVFGPVSLEGIGDFRILSLADPRWEDLFLDKDTVGSEICWRGIRLEDFTSLAPKRSIGQEALPFYRNQEKQGFHPGYAIYAEFVFRHPDSDELIVEDRFFKEEEGGFAPLDLVLPGEEFLKMTEGYSERIHWISRSEGDATQVLLRYQVPADAYYYPKFGTSGELTVEEVRQLRDQGRVGEVLIALDIRLQKEGAVLCRWEPEQSGIGLTQFWYGSCKRSEGLPQGTLCWLAASRSVYGDTEKRFP